MTPRLLDLFAGAGGAAMGYSRAGFDVVGVDHVAQPNYPFTFIKVDALEFLQRLIANDMPHGWSNMSIDGSRYVNFDAIHASPPCQEYSRALSHMSAPQPRLIDPVRELLEQTGLLWVIENVPGAPLPQQTTLDGRYGVELCGTMFGSRVWRHRLFETSFPIGAPRGCDHREPSMNPHNQIGRDRIYAEFGKQNPDPIWNREMGVPWMTKEEGREAIPPAMTEYVGHQLLVHIQGEGSSLGTSADKPQEGRV